MKKKLKRTGEQREYNKLEVRSWKSLEMKNWREREGWLRV